MRSKRQQFFDAKKEKMEYLKTHDSLTGMFNLAGMRRHTGNLKLSNYNLMLVDIYGFKRINDYYGYNEGNRVLAEFANFLLKHIGSKGIVARDGSDEFIILLKKKVNTEGWSPMMLYEIMAEYFGEVLTFPVDLACGIASGNDNNTIDDVYSMAEDAMYNQKASGQPGIMLYDETMRRQHIRERSLSLELHQAFEKKEFILYFQPQLHSGEEIIGYEALVRWQHPTRGVLSPGVFLHLIKKENLIKKLDYYIIERAFEVMRKWQDQGNQTKLSINLTTITLLDKELITYIKAMSEKYEVTCERLYIEITEDYEIFEQDTFRSVIDTLRSQGIKVAIDDFGTGYASLNKIIKYDVDVIKIDKTMVDNIVESPRDLTMLRGIIGIFKEIGIRLVIEGVETEAQVACINDIEGLVYQGYYFGCPMPDQIDK